MSNFDWDNVAVSKDGKLLAGVSTDIDGAIWVMQISEGVWTKFNLYNPTYSQGVSAGNVNYADAIEFDHTGQYILYDAQNELTNASGTNITWWDLGVIRVWNKDQNDWGDGKVEKVFMALAEFGGAAIKFENGRRSRNEFEQGAIDKENLRDKLCSSEKAPREELCPWHREAAKGAAAARCSRCMGRGGGIRAAAFKG